MVFVGKADSGGAAGQVRRQSVNLVKLLTTPQPLQWHPSAGLDLGTDKTSLSNIILGRESGLKEDRREGQHY